MTLTCRVSDPDGNLIDDGSNPFTYLHGGYGGIFEAVELALHGKAAGVEVELKLQPEDAFGDYDPELVLIEPASLFPDNIEVGMRFERASEDGEDDTVFTITDIADGKVVIDGNHPLAGVALVFRCAVTGVRKASAEEVAHGHVHGEHGHHH